jgi:hypothetical protein
VLAASIILLITLMMKTASTSETSVNFCQTTQSNNLEDSHLQKILGLMQIIINIKIKKYQISQYNDK